jgi:DnaJ-class molecular chaperone
MSTITTTVRIVPCRDCKGTGANIEHDRSVCRGCDGRGQVVATSERLLVGLVMRWDAFR